jgi:hypothetical protein
MSPSRVDRRPLGVAPRARAAAALAALTALTVLTVLTAGPLAAAKSGAGSVEKAALDLAVGQSASPARESIVFATTLTGWIDWSENWLASLDWGFAWVSVAETGAPARDGLWWGNPAFAAHYRALLDGWRLRVGLGIVAPAAQLDTASAAETARGAYAYQRAAGIVGGWDPWLWAPDTLSFIVPARVESLAGSVLLGAELGVGVLVGVQEHVDDVGAVLQLGFDAAYVSDIVRLGLGLYGVWTPTAARDEFQGSLEPYLRLETDPVFIRLAFTVNLDTPYGTSFADDGLWGLRLGVGADL